MKTQKTVQIIARYTHKTDGKPNGTISYLVRSANGKSTYCTTIVNGVASGCSCPAHSKCYHMKQLEAKEQQRQETANQFAAKSAPSWAMNLVNTGKLQVPAKVEEVAKVEAPVVPTYTNMFKKPWNKIAEQREQRENYREIKAQSREIRERRDMGERGNLNTGRAFSLMR